MYKDIAEFLIKNLNALHEFYNSKRNAWKDKPNHSAMEDVDIRQDQLVI